MERGERIAKRVGADPRVCPNNSEQPALPYTLNTRSDTGVCPYPLRYSLSSLHSPLDPQGRFRNEMEKELSTIKLTLNYEL